MMERSASGRRDDSAGEGAVVHQPPRPRRGRAHRARVRRAGRCGDQAHESLRRRDRRFAGRRLSSARAMPTAWRPSAGSSGSTGRSTSPTAEAIVSTFIEAVIAPVVDEAARAVARAQDQHARRHGVVRRVPRRRRGPPIDSRRAARAGARSRGRGAAAVALRIAARGLRVVTKREPTAEEWEALRFAWRVCAHVKSNTVIFTDARRTLAIGAGQMSRVDAVNVAVMKAAGAAVSLQRLRRGVRRVLPVSRRPRRRGDRPARRRSCSRADRCATPR